MFIYEENASGIKRWTDGVTWSPSRILGNFLVYRELDKPFPPGEKKRAMKKQQRRPSRPGEPYPSPDGSFFADSQSSSFAGERQPSEVERQLIGSLIDSYGFKQDGLVKKTMSVTVQGVTHHLVSYYSVADVMANNLRTPSQTENLQYIRPRPELTSKQSFRAPIEEADDITDGPTAYGYRLGPHGYMHEYKTQYFVPQGYPPLAQQPQPGVGAYPGSVPSMPPTYLPTSVPAPQMQSQRSDYGQYDHTAYNRPYDSLTNPLPATSRSIPATPASTMAPGMTDRTPTQPAMYPPMSMQRPMTSLSPVSMDSRHDVPYRSNPYPVTSTAPALEPQRQNQPSPNHLKYEDRRDSAHQGSQLFSSSRSAYYSDASAQAMPKSQYTPGPPMGHWTGPGHASQ